MFALITTEVLDNLNQIMIKQLKNRYNDPTGKTRRFVLGIDRGKIYFYKLVNKLMKEKPLLIPYAITQTVSKYLGYKIGLHANKFPNWLKESLTGQKYYWRSKYYVK
jgi:hypothetical protein|tara:strand:- start:260 stop:580 length:321 start_codon:yes stop_codon:yes gene_type:complete